MEKSNHTKKWILIAIGSAVVFIVALTIYFFVTREKGNDTLVLYGNVDVRQVDIGFRVEGQVTQMPFEEGDYVAKGTLMATIDDQPYLDEVQKQRANVRAIQFDLDNADILLKRRLELVSEGGVSKEDLDNAITSRDVLASQLKEAKAMLSIAEENLSFTKRFAPIDGTILTRIREPGTVVRVADPIYTLSVISPVWVRAFVSEPNLGRIYPNMPAKIITDTKGGKIYDGHIGFISPVAEFTPKTVETTQLRTDLVYRIRVTVDNPDWGLKQGMPVTVKLINDQRDDER
jgi:HlyD family secretion protein